MKKKVFLPIIIGIFFSVTIATNLYCQNKTVRSVPANYCSSNKSPLMFLKGDTIITDCDTTYIVNKERYSFYKNIHEATLSGKDSVSGKILKAFELRLLEQQNAYDKLLSNSKQAEKITLDLINDTQSSLLSTQKTLENTQISLENTLKSLETANKLIKKEKWNSKGQKLLVGAGGVGIGLIIGLLIMK